jgi:protein-L-isoaspartate(D-aspartate) O-methyltransferase
LLPDVPPPSDPPSPPDPGDARAQPGGAVHDPEVPFQADRAAMVHDQLTSGNRHITHPLVLRAMARIPRHAFVPAPYVDKAYADHPLPIGHRQTISQPFIVAFMTEALDPLPHQRILEIGTGSGYQTAVLASLVREVHTLEIVPELSRSAEATLHQLGVRNVSFHVADGSLGWPDAAPYDGILVACAPHRIPAPLIDQLKDGGRMILPVGDIDQGQELVVLEKHGSRVDARNVLPVRFVPMTGGGIPGDPGSGSEVHR